MKKVFPSAFPIILGHDKIVKTAFYKWLDQNHSAGEDVTHFIPAIKAYTGMEKPFVGRVDGETHKSVYNVFWAKINKLK
jgi:hypothetical protein